MKINHFPLYSLRVLMAFICSIALLFESVAVYRNSIAVSDTPTVINEIPFQAIKIDDGAATCALTQQAEVVCFGLNVAGVLGNNLMTGDSAVPVKVSGLTSIQTISSNAFGQVCALTAMGSVKCWGLNTNGGLGNGTSGGFSAVPVDVIGLSLPVTQLSDSNNTCALLSNQTVKCWGLNLFENVSLLGNPSVGQFSSVPVDVIGLDGPVAKLATGAGFANCAILVAGNVKCWGVLVNSSTAISIPGLESGVVTVSVGAYHACALLINGKVKCWGTNDFGQLGLGTMPVGTGIPTEVLGLSNVTDISLRGDTSCALIMGGSVKCWGENRSGKVGDGTTVDRDVPIQVSGLNSNVIALNGACVIMNDGNVKCWGSRSPKELSGLSPISIVGFGNTPICGNNLLTNPGYESGLTGWNRWDATSSDTAAPYTGSRALKLAGTAGGVGQVVAATPGQIYTANMWGKIISGSVGSFGIRFYDNNWANLGTVARDITGGQYQPYRIEAVAPANTVRAELWVNKTNDQGEQHADEMCLFASGGGTPATPTPTATVVGPAATPTRTPTATPIATATATPIGPTPTRTPTITPSPTQPVTVSPTPTATLPPATCSANLLNNPGFEQSFTGWVRWDANNAIVPDARSGTKAVRLGTAASGIGQGLAATPGQNYSLTAYAKRQNSSANAVLGLTFFDDQWRGINAQSVANINSSNYATYTVSGVAPANARYAIAWVSKQAADSGYVFADDFCLTGASSGGAVSASLRQNADGTWSSAEAVRSFEAYLPLLGN